MGMIMWPKAKRYVEPSLAQEIASAARENGAEPVGVFVDEDTDHIMRVCEASSISIAQLHGDRARQAFHGLTDSVRAIYVVHANPEGDIKTAPPPGALESCRVLPCRWASRGQWCAIRLAKIACS